MPIKHISSLEELDPHADVYLCDVWGVIHNGMRPYASAVEALKGARARGKTVVLITNSPRPAAGVEQQFETIGVDLDCYDAIVTSGDVTRELAAAALGPVYFLGPERDHALMDGLNLTLSGPEEAASVLCTGLFDDENERPEDYHAMLEAWAERKVPLICANPDLYVERGERIIPCAGALAALYTNLGGETRIAGKPHAPIYREAIRRAEALRGETQRDRFIAIGDGALTDIKGALDNGIAALFIARGIHGRSYTTGGDIDPARLEAFLSREGFVPGWWMEWLM